MVISTLDSLKIFAKSVLAQYPNGGVFGLSGELGLGKTTFVRFFTELLASKKGRVPPVIRSPSFILYEYYQALEIHHFDLYRLERVTSEDLIEIGYENALFMQKEKNGYIFVEWPEKSELLNRLYLHAQIVFSWSGANRNVIIEPLIEPC